MKIAVNARMLLPGKLDGIGWFAHETLQRIVKAHPEHIFYFIFDRKYDPAFIYASNVRPVVIPVPARHPILWYVYFKMVMPLVLKIIKPDLLFSPEGYMPAYSACKRAITMHDIAYEHFPWSVPKAVLTYYRKYFRRNSIDADLLFTVSDFSKNDLIKTYALPETKIIVVPNGCNPQYQKALGKDIEIAKHKFTDSMPYFIFIGSMFPRKNILRLMNAFNLFKKINNNSSHKLLLVGFETFMKNDYLELKSTLEFGDHIIFCGRVEDIKTLNALLSGAEALTYISLFEGFGIPCLEAMNAGCAVIASNTSSLPEVCGDAAIYVDPLSEAQIANAMVEIVNQPELKESLITKGFARASNFSWEHTAENIWNGLVNLYS
jgi:glycosyltransferase involved in cell wall biosynthesis